MQFPSSRAPNPRTAFPLIDTLLPPERNKLPLQLAYMRCQHSTCFFSHLRLLFEAFVDHFSACYMFFCASLSHLTNANATLPFEARRDVCVFSTQLRVPKPLASPFSYSARRPFRGMTALSSCTMLSSPFPPMSTSPPSPPRGQFSFCCAARTGAQQAFRNMARLFLSHGLRS